MKTKKHSHLVYWLAIIVVLAATVGLGYSVFGTNNQISDLNSQLSTASAQLTAAQNNLSQLEGSVNQAQSSLSYYQSELSKVTSNIAEAQGQVVATQNQYIAKEQAMSAGSVLRLVDPTYQQMTDFLNNDPAMLKAFKSATYGDYARCSDVIADAIAQNYRCGLVSISFLRNPTDSNFSRYTIIAFNTMDKGLIYIDPYSGTQAVLAIGLHYWARLAPTPGFSSWAPPTWDDTIVKYTIVW